MGEKKGLRAPGRVGYGVDSGRKGAIGRWAEASFHWKSADRQTFHVNARFADKVKILSIL